MTMRTPFTIAVLCLLSLGAHAQHFGGGAFVGLSTSQVTGDNLSGFNKVGFWGGGFTDYRFTPKSTMQLELTFIQKGSRQTPTVKNGNVFYVMNLNYLEIPVLYKWYGIRNMSVEIGPQFGFLLANTEEDNAGEIPQDPDTPFKVFELSGSAGLSYYFWKGRIEANARYSNSILPIRGEVVRWPYGGQLNQIISFSVRWWFKNTYDAPPKKEKSVRNLE